MFKKNAQKKIIIVVAAVLVVALIGSTFSGFGSLFSNPNSGTEGTSEDAQAAYNQIVATIGLYETMLADDPSNVALRNALASSYMQKAQSALTENAQADWEKALEGFQAYLAAQETPTVEALFNVALAQQNAQQYEQAKETYLKLLEMEANNLATLYNYGLLLFNMGDYEQALAQWEKAKSLTQDTQVLTDLNTRIQLAQMMQTNQTEQENQEGQEGQENQTE